LLSFAAMTRRRLNVADRGFFPAYVVWELTLKCDHACLHCGSRASAARPDELSTEEALKLAAQLIAMGTTDVVLIGGEAYLHDGFLSIIEALAKAGVRVGLTTGGRGVDEALAQQMKDHGLHQVSVSVDGLEQAHDRMRNQRGSFAGTQRALAAVKKVGLVAMANTNFNRSNMMDLEPLFEILAPQITTWQIQITTPLGRAADRTDMLLQPWDLLDLVPRVAAVKELGRTRGVTIMPGNNLGYFGPEEALLRSQRKGDRDHWSGCQAGRYVMGIESDGAVKGCPSLQTSHYVGGNAKEASVKSIWEQTPELAFTRARTREDLWGYCKTCVFGDVCLGGCSFTAHSVLGRPGNNPYCHFRAREHQKQGLRERLVPKDAAPGLPFDNGLFEVVVEPFETADPGADKPLESLVQISRRPTRTAPSSSV
jgi:radical SAM protein with 4Fe4S-binding SPASM domain